MISPRYHIGDRIRTALACAFAAVCAAFVPNFAQASEIELLSKCELDLMPKFTVITGVTEEKKISPRSIDEAFVRKNCQANLGQGVNLAMGELDYNYQQALADPNVRFEPFVNIPERRGACEQGWNSIRNQYLALEKAHGDFCKEHKKLQTSVEDCTKASKDKAESCLKQFQEGERTLTRLIDRNEILIDKSKEELQKREDRTKSVFQVYLSDRQVIAATAESEISGLNLRGQAGTADFATYKNNIAPSVATKIKRDVRSEGRLIDEQRNVTSNISNFRDTLTYFQEDKRRLSTALKTQADDIEKSFKKNGWLDDLKTAAPGMIAPGISAGTQLYNGTRTPSALSGSGLSGGTALAGAAVIGAAALSANAGSGASSSVPIIPGLVPVAGAAPGGTADPASAVLAGGGTGVAGGANTLAGRGNELAGDAAKTDEEKAAEATATPAMFSFTGGFTSSDGASRALKVNRINQSAPAEGKVEGGGGGEALGGAVGGNKPNSAKPSNAAGEVTALLGQMKSLFNFDEGGGVDNAGGTPGSPHADGYGAPGDPGAGPMGPGGTIGSDGDYVADGDGQAAADAMSGEEVFLQSENLRADKNSLFVRVRVRHRKALEKGLIISRLGGVAR